jgi:hypothetical protein
MPFKLCVLVPYQSANEAQRELYQAEKARSDEENSLKHEH